VPKEYRGLLFAKTLAADVGPDVCRDGCDKMFLPENWILGTKNLSCLGEIRMPMEKRSRNWWDTHLLDTARRNPQLQDNLGIQPNERTCKQGDSKPTWRTVEPHSKLMSRKSTRRFVISSLAWRASISSSDPGMGRTGDRHPE